MPCQCKLLITLGLRNRGWPSLSPVDEEKLISRFRDNCEVMANQLVEPGDLVTVRD